MIAWRCVQPDFDLLNRTKPQLRPSTDMNTAIKIRVKAVDWVMHMHMELDQC